MRNRHKSKSIASTFDGLRSDYAASKASRFRRRRTGISSMGSAADYHFRSEADYLRMLEYARDMDRNDAVIGQMVDRAVNNTIQNGMVPDPQTGDKETDAILLDLFTEWANDPQQCDVSGRFNFFDQQELVFRATLVDGDILPIPTSMGGIELIESHRLRTPSNTKRNVIHGVLLDDLRRRKEYWVTKDDVDPLFGLSRVSDTRPIAAYTEDGQPNAFHVYNPKRVSQTRGVTALAPVFDVAGMFEDINFAKLVQQQIVSCFAVIRNLDLGAKRIGTEQYGDRETQALTDGAKRLIDEIAPGMELTGEPGEKIEGFSPNIPNPGAMEHFRLMLTLLGVNLGLPLVMVTMDASDTNFSGWRGAVDQARMGFKRNQRWMIDHFLKPVYRWKVRQWMDHVTGDERLARKAAELETKNLNIFKHEWTAPKWPYIQPLQDAQADALRVEKRQTSPRRQLKERGLDIDVIRSETVNDTKGWMADYVVAYDEFMGEHGDTLNKHGQAVTLQDFMNFYSGDPVKAAVITKLDGSGEEINQGELVDA